MKWQYLFPVPFKHKIVHSLLIGFHSVGKCLEFVWFLLAIFSGLAYEANTFVSLVHQSVVCMCILRNVCTDTAQKNNKTTIHTINVVSNF